MSEVANKIVDSILLDISDRCGLGNAMYDISDDIQRDIKEEWMDIIDNNLRLKKEPEPETNETNKLLRDAIIVQRALVSLQVITIGTGLQSDWSERDSNRLFDETNGTIDVMQKELEENV